MINYEVYSELYAEAKTYTDLSMYIMRGWQDWMDGMTAEQITDLMGKIYQISTEGIEGMLSVEGMKLTVFCRKYQLPYHTAQKWRSGESTPPEYVLLLLGWAVIS